MKNTLKNLYQSAMQRVIRALPDTVLLHLTAIRDAWQPLPSITVSQVVGGDILQPDENGRHTIEFRTRVSDHECPPERNRFVLDLTNKAIDFKRSNIPFLHAYTPGGRLARMALVNSPVLRALQPVFDLRQQHLDQLERRAQAETGTDARTAAFQRALCAQLSDEVRETYLLCQGNADRFVDRVMRCTDRDELRALLQQCDRAPAPSYLSAKFRPHIEQLRWIHPSGLEVALAVLTYPRHPVGCRTNPEVHILLRIGESGEALFEEFERHATIEEANAQGLIGAYRVTLPHHPQDDEPNPFADDIPA